MAEAYQMSKDGKAGLLEAAQVFSDLPWMKDKNGDAFIFDAKKDEYVPVKKGDYIVSIGERFEVSDTEPEKAKPVEAPEPDEDEDDE